MRSLFYELENRFLEKDWRHLERGLSVICAAHSIKFVVPKVALDELRLKIIAAFLHPKQVGVGDFDPVNDQGLSTFPMIFPIVG
jgi:hypothetical protein